MRCEEVEQIQSALLLVTGGVVAALARTRG
jgi:hypothetical protein